MQDCQPDTFEVAPQYQAKRPTPTLALGSIINTIFDVFIHYSRIFTTRVEGIWRPCHGISGEDFYDVEIVDIALGFPHDISAASERHSADIRQRCQLGFYVD